MPKSKRVFRIAFTPKWNSGESGKSLSELAPALFKYGNPISYDLIKPWREEIQSLNKQYPELHHWIDNEQPDENGVFAYPVISHEKTVAV